MKKKSTFFALSLFVLSITGIRAQQHPAAPTLNPILSDDFGKKAEIEQLGRYKEHKKDRVAELEKFTRDYVERLKKEGRTSAFPDTSCVLTIPVVFHVFHAQGGNAVTMDQINEAIADLNRNWSGKNTDWADVNSNFSSIKTYSRVRWVLAKIDPKGNPTTGVEYYLEQTGGWGNGSGMDGQIADVAWDNYKYFNVYITHDLYQNGVFNNSGVCWYPDVDMSNDGTARMVYNHAYLGKGGTSNNDLMFNREFTHETGHFLNLIHTFEGLTCVDNATNGDQVDDTPSTDQAGGTCPTGTATISGCGHIINWENYMDYYAQCNKMFTAGQMTRVDAALLSPARQSLYQYDNLVATGVLSPSSSNPCITKMFSFSKTKLDEALVNDGSIETPPVIIRAVGGFTFAKTGKTLIAGTDYSISNVPAGLTAVVVTSGDGKSATLSFNGTATSHDASDINVVLTFKDAAVTGGNVAAIPNYTKQFNIHFNSPYITTCAITTLNLTTDNASNTWQIFETSGPVRRYYGVWWDGAAFRFENYGKMIMTTMATSDNVQLVDAGVKIGPSSAWRDAYPGTKFQRGYIIPYIYAAGYTAWDGKTGYIGVRLQKGADFYYGWIKLQVAAGGSSVTLVEYLINNYPNAPVLAGGTCTTVTGIEDHSMAMDMNVFLAPNPVHGDVTIIKNLSADYTGGNYLICSVDGKLMHSGEIQGMEQTIETQGFNSGLYFVHVSNKEQTKFANLKLCKTK